MCAGVFNNIWQCEYMPEPISLTWSEVISKIRSSKWKGFSKI